MQTLRVLDIDRLDVTVQLLLRTLLVVSLSRDADTESVWNTLDTSFPDLLVQLGIETNIGGTLLSRISPPFFNASSTTSKPGVRTIDFVANALISLMALGARFLNVTP